MDLEAIRALVADDFVRVDAALQQCLQSETTLIQQLGNHLVRSGGKRLRPLLVLLSARALAYQGNAHIQLAAIIELIHTVTLLHDDVVDASDLRRGQKTANAVWGNAASVLVGDFLYSRAFQLMVGINSLRILAILADASNVIAKGEILQLLNCKDPDTTEQRYLEVIQAKTGKLFATAAQLGAIVAGCTENIVTAMLNYGMHLGIAFQLVDDALDYSASSVVLGKSQGDDLAEGKPTLPLIYALQKGNAEQRSHIQQAIQHASREELEVVLAAIESTGAIAYTYQVAAQHVESAIGYLAEIPDSSYRQALIALAEFAIKRSY